MLEKTLDFFIKSFQSQSHEIPRHRHSRSNEIPSHSSDSVLTDMAANDAHSVEESNGRGNRTRRHIPDSSTGLGGYMHGGHSMA